MFSINQQLAGEVSCEFKLKDWTLTVKSPAGGTEQVTVSPLLTASDVVSQLTTRFSLPASEEYGLYSSSNTFVRVMLTPGAAPETRRPGTWLVDNKQLHTYPDINQKGKVLELRSKPKALKIKFKDDTGESTMITGTTLVREILDETAARAGITKEHAGDYGMCIVGAVGAATTWLEPDKPLAAYGLQDGMGVVRFILRPMPLQVLLPDQTERTTLLVHATHPVKDVIAEICEQAKLDLDEGYSLRRGTGACTSVTGCVSMQLTLFFNSGRGRGRGGKPQRAARRVEVAARAGRRRGGHRADAAARPQEEEGLRRRDRRCKYVGGQGRARAPLERVAEQGTHAHRTAHTPLRSHAHPL